jgi:glycolate oxidase FAD binding subunit
VIVTDAPAAVREAVDPWGPVDPARLALMRSVKARFDPTGACAPGLFVGGI